MESVMAVPGANARALPFFSADSVKWNRPIGNTKYAPQSNRKTETIEKEKTLEKTERGA
ncbi:hypothetical protein [Allobaculum fili]|uniref:hypothetical protein n=1 Tax=Allobaculum fili TaxID=2834460 RepID=UPI001E548B6A|nr:hypothetical protein [Allobaculum fili]